MISIPQNIQLHPLQTAILMTTSVKDFIDATEALIAENDEIENNNNAAAETDNDNMNDGNDNEKVISSLRTTTTRDIIVAKAKELFASIEKAPHPQRFRSEEEEEKPNLDDHNKLVLTVIRLVFLFLLEPANEQGKCCAGGAGGCCGGDDHHHHEHDENKKCCGGDDKEEHHDCCDHDHDNDDDGDINFMKQVSRMMSVGILDLLITNCISSPDTRNGVVLTVATNIRELVGYGEMFFQAKQMEKEYNKNKNNNNATSPSALLITTESLFPITQELSAKLTTRLAELASSDNEYDRSICEELCGVCLCICCSEFALKSLQQSEQVVENFVRLFDLFLSSSNDNNNDKNQGNENDEDEDQNQGSSTSFSNSTRITFLEVIIHVTSNPAARALFLANKKFLPSVASVVSSPHPVNIFERLSVILNNLTWDCKEMAEFAFYQELFETDGEKKILLIDILIEQLYNCFKAIEKNNEAKEQEEDASEGPIAYLFGALSNLILMNPTQGKKRLLQEFSQDSSSLNLSKIFFQSSSSSSSTTLKEIESRINAEVFFCNVITGSEIADDLYAKHAPFYLNDASEKGTKSDEILQNMLITMKRGIEHTPGEVKQYQNPEFLKSFKSVFSRAASQNNDDDEDADSNNFSWLVAKIIS